MVALRKVDHAFPVPPNTEDDLAGVQVTLWLRLWLCISITPLALALIVNVQHPLFVSSDYGIQPVG